MTSSSRPAAGHARAVVIWAALLTLVPVGVLIAERAGLVNGDVLFRDTAAAAGAPYFYGYLSTITVLMWGAACGVCLVAALALPRRDALFGFFVSSFLLSILLAVDDGLLWHEEFLPARGIPEPAVYAAYGAAIVTWAVVNRSRFSLTAYGVLAGSIALLGASVLLDFYERVFSPLGDQVVIEDGLKFVGIGLWLAYFVVSGATGLSRPRSDADPRVDGLASR